jgi:putative SOS response-associated peptidase YedK
MCNLYSLTKGQQAIRDVACAMSDRTGNLPLLPGIYPDYRAPIVRNQAEGRELTMARWGMPSPVNNLFAILTDPGAEPAESAESAERTIHAENVSAHKPRYATEL